MEEKFLSQTFYIYYSENLKNFQIFISFFNKNFLKFDKNEKLGQVPITPYITLYTSNNPSKMPRTTPRTVARGGMTYTYKFTYKLA